MSVLTQTKTIAGSRAFTLVRPKPSRISNGTKCYMRRKDTYLIEIQVGEEEGEDSAVRNYMSAVVQTGVIDKLLARRRMETKVEKRERETRERIALRKSGVEEPTWEESYGLDTERKVFDEFFCQGEAGDGFDGFLYDDMLGGAYGQDDGLLGGGFQYGTENINGASQWGGYVEQPAGRSQGGYMGGYGGYIN